MPLNNFWYYHCQHNTKRASEMILGTSVSYAECSTQLLILICIQIATKPATVETRVQCANYPSNGYATDLL